MVLQDDTRGFMTQKDLSHSFFVEAKPKRPQQPVNSSPVDPPRQHTSPLRALPSPPSTQIDPGANLPTNRAEGSFDASAEPSIVLEELSPDNGPITGGIKILLVGANFPMSPLFVRFGRNITMAVLPA